LAAGHAVPETETESDEALVLLVGQGDQQAFEELYERYFKRVYHFVDKRLRNSADTDETVQEVFINIFNSVAGFRGDAPFAAWVFGVTRRTIASRFKRKRHPMVPLGDEEHEMAASSSSGAPPSPLEVFEYEELLEQIESKLETRLSEEQRQLFQLHHLEERPISEIAEMLRKSENAVKSNLYRARKILLAR
jgi:RNA polymerase sigma-70 factor (ECF subfamily)